MLYTPHPYPFLHPHQRGVSLPLCFSFLVVCFLLWWHVLSYLVTNHSDTPSCHLVKLGSWPSLLILLHLIRLSISHLKKLFLKNTVLFIIQQAAGGQGEGLSMDSLPILPWVSTCFPKLEGWEVLGCRRTWTQLLILGQNKWPWPKYQLTNPDPRPTSLGPLRPLGARLTRLWGSNPRV